MKFIESLYWIVKNRATKQRSESKTLTIVRQLRTVLIDETI
jgi:hypothetical protein